MMACEHGVPFGFTCDKCPPPSEDGMIEIDIVRDQKPLSERETYEKLVNDIMAQKEAIILEAVGGTNPTEKIKDGGNMCMLQDGSEVFSLYGVDLLVFKAPTAKSTLENGRTVIQANQAYWRLDR